MTIPVSGTFARGGIAVESLKAKTAAGEVAITRRVLGTAPSGHVAANRAAGVGSANNAAVSTPSNTSVSGARATATGAAFNATAVGPLSANAVRAIGTGAANSASVSVPALANAGRAAGTGTAQGPAADNGSTGPLVAPFGTRFSTGEDLTLLDGPVTAPPGAITVTPGGTDLETLSIANPAGTTFYLLAGKHTLPAGTFDQIPAKAGNIYVGAPGAVIDGQFVNRYCFSGNGSGVIIRYLEICNFVSPFDEFVVNHDTGPNWTIEYCNIHSNSAAAVGLGDGNVLQYSWLHHNRQYGFSGFNEPVGAATSNAVNNATIDHCEIQGNGDPIDEWNPDGSPTNFGRNGGGKFWDTGGMTVTNNWVHHSNFVGIWADTNNVNMRLEGNLIEDIWGEGFFYEISYNFLVQFNTFRRCCLGKGVLSNVNGDNFPRPAVYISESGSEARLATASNSTSEIRFNRFINNWDDIALWESSDRFCNSLANTSNKLWKPLGGAASLAVCNNPTPRTLTVTLTSGSPNFTVVSGTFDYWDEGEFVSGTGIPAGTKIREPSGTAFSAGWVDATHGIMTNNATTSGTVTMTIAAGSITSSPGFYDCRWHTQHVRIHDNRFDHHRADVLGPNNTLSSGMATGKMSVISQTGTAPSWSPYKGSIVQNAITFNQDNVWSANTYRGNYTQWMPFDTATNKSFAQWQAAPYGQDAGSTLSTTPPTGNGGGNYYKPAAPTSVTAVAGPASAQISFVPPIDTGGDHIVGYTVTASPGGATGTAVGGPINVTGLTNSTAYTFTVRARTSIGLGTASSASSSVTPTSGASALPTAKKPWHPRYPTARKRTFTTAEVSFVEPAATGSTAITGYTVTSSPGGLTGTGTTGPITVTGLTAGTTYTFTVTATNSVGTGVASPATGSITLDTSPMNTRVATGTGTANNAAANAGPPVGRGQGTGAVNTSVQGVRMATTAPDGAGAANAANAKTTASAGVAAGTGAANAATVQINGGFGVSGYGVGGYGV